MRLEGEHSRLLFEEASDGMFLSVEGRYIAVNRSGHRLLGYEDGELIGKRIADIVLESDLPRLHAALCAITRGELLTQIWSLVRKDGSYVRSEVVAQLLSNGSVLAVVRDLHARSEFQRALQASEDRLQSILLTAADTILTVDRQGRVLYINRTFPPYTVEQVIGSSCFDYVPPDARARVARAIEHVFNTRSFDEYVVEAPDSPNGERRWSSVRAGPLLEADRVVAAILCATDVTERMRASEQNRELLERMRKIASMVPGMVSQFQLRPDGRMCFPYASDGAREILRVAPEDLREDAAPFVQLIHPDDYAASLTSLTRSATTLEPWQHEFRLKFSERDVRWVSGNAMPERLPDGSGTAF